LQSHPRKAVPVVLNTMEMFRSSFMNKKKDMQAHWRSECVKNWYKSLDHKNFNFRQNERKTQNSREFLNKLKEKAKEYENLKDLESQKQALKFSTNFEGSEIRILDLKVDPEVDSSHPFLLEDPLYYEHFEKLPHFRFLMNDQEILKLVVKFLYLYIDHQNGNNQKQKSFFVSFCKYFLNLGFSEENLKKFKSIEMSEEFLEILKDRKTFYEEYEKNGAKDREIFDTFFFEQEKEVIVNIGTTRTDSAKSVIPLGTGNGILNLEEESVNDEASDQEKSSNASVDPYLSFAKEAELKDRIEHSKFLPLFQDDQILLYGTTKQYYSVLRFVHALYERIKLAKNSIPIKLREDIKFLKEEHQMDVTKIQQDFAILEEYKFK
jgi:hypothetical protein